MQSVVEILKMHLVFRRLAKIIWLVKKKPQQATVFHILYTAYAIDNIYARGDKMVEGSIMWDGRHSVSILTVLLWIVRTPRMFSTYCMGVIWSIVFPSIFICVHFFQSLKSEQQKNVPYMNGIYSIKLNIRTYHEL